MTEMNHTGYLLKTTTELQPLDLGQYFMEMSSNLSLEYIPRDCIWVLHFKILPSLLKKCNELSCVPAAKLMQILLFCACKHIQS